MSWFENGRSCYTLKDHPFLSLSAYTRLILRFHQSLGVLNLCQLVDTAIETLILVYNRASALELAVHERRDKTEITANFMREVFVKLVIDSKY